MTLTIEAPDTRAPERNYILGVLLSDFLGLPWRRISSERRDVRITLKDQSGEIRMPDALFSIPEADWLTDASMPRRPLKRWDTRDLAGDITLVDPVVPVIYGIREPGTQREGSTITLPVDIFGSAFFMLSRYEELVTPDRDEHDRFPARASVAYQEEFLERPIVDEYLEILWAAMSGLWPSLKRQRRTASTFITCDVDSPFCYDGSLKKMIRRCGGDLLKRHSLRSASRTVVGSWQARKGDHQLDPHRKGIDYIMDVNERAGRSAAFYFIAEKTDPARDKPVSLNDPRMRTLLRDIRRRGHEIGLHPGYNTYRHPETMARSVHNLRQAMAEEGLEQEQLGGRQHFLRWKMPITARLWNKYGLDYDSSLGFADRPGFRCGTSREYRLYDLEDKQTLRIRERPLIVMECSVIARRYMGLGYSDEAWILMKYFRDTCHRFGGRFSLLWHNSYLDGPRDREFYQQLIQPLSVVNTAVI